MGLASMTSIVGLPRKLGFLDSLSIVVGNVIGSAIFLGANSVAQSLPSGPLIVAAWVFAGAISLFGALAFAELGAMMPETGGQYVHMRETFGRFWAFLFGWALFLVIRSGGTAALAVGFSIYLGYFLPLEIWGRKLAAVAIVGLLTYVNYRGVVLSAGVFVLRRKYPDLPRPYRVWGYPWAPALFVGMALAFLVNTLLTKPGPALMGLAIIATGVPAYWFWARRISRARTTTTRL